MAAVQLEAIAFNHDSASADHDALTLRWNHDTPMAVPEWRRGVNFQAADSVAAYAVRETLGQTLTLRAQFSSTDPSLPQVEIRAVSDQPFSEWPWSYTPVGGWPGLPANNVLGAVKARPVTFRPDGTTDFETFELSNNQISQYGVGSYQVAWRWQYRTQPDQSWTTFAASQHKIYITLAVPTAPWLQDPQPHNTQQPWAEVLDYACEWARGSLHTDRAAARITEAVYSLGPELIEYNCPNLGAPMYVMPDPFPPPHTFDCTAFLERLRGGIGRGRYVNCSDCAAIVSTFANSLGCDLWQSRMGLFPQGFSINPILAIGSIQWQQPCGFWPGFGMHEVAWKDACGEDDAVFDACLAIDIDFDPTRFPHSPLIPTNFRFGRPGEGQYRERLAAPIAVQDCAPWPVSRQRRIVI